MKLLCFIFFFYIGYLVGHTQANNNFSSNIYFYHLGLEDGLSQINVMSIYQDEFGAIWLGTTEGINKYNGKKIETFRNIENLSGVNRSTIFNIEGDKNGLIYILADRNIVKYNLKKQAFSQLPIENITAIVYQNGSLWVASDHDILQYNDQTNQFIKYASVHKSIGKINVLSWINDSLWIGGSKGLSVISKDEQTIFCENMDVSSLLKDSSGNIFVGTSNHGVMMLNPAEVWINFRHVNNQNSISNNSVRTMVEGKNGEIWIGTFLGLNLFKPQTNTWTNYTSNDNINYALSHNSIFALLKDIQGTIWVGTYFGGVSYFNTDLDKFQYYGASSTDKHFLSFPYISRMVEDNLGHLWVCTEGGGLNCLDLETQEISRYMFSQNDFEAISSNNLKCIWYDKDSQKLYIGTHNGGLIVFDILKRQYKRIEKSSAPNGLPDNTINKIQYYQGNLILLTIGGLYKMDLKTEKFYPINAKIDENLFNNFLLLDSKHRLWISKKDNIYTIDLAKNNEITEVNLQDLDKNAIYTDIFETKQGEIYISTLGRGILKYNEPEKKFEKYLTEKNGLKNDYIYAISQLPSGKLILLHTKGISILDVNNINAAILTTNAKFPIIGFNYGSSVYTTTNGVIFVGGVNGLVSFYEDQLHFSDRNYNLYFDKLYVNHELILPEDHSGVLDEALAFSKLIKLKREQNNIIIEFASSNYLNTSRNYEYKLEGYDGDWINTSSPVITYTNLSRGNYKLNVREKTDDGHAVIYTLDIVVTPPFYLTTFAFLIYFLLILGILYIVTRIYTWRFNVETSLKYEQKEKQRIEELNQNKLRFFTNVSHEFRTPLTLILGQIDLLLSRNDLTNAIQSKIINIRRNANHLLLLITELLDFRKYEQGHVRLNIQKTELISYIQEITQSFTDYAQKKDISFEIRTDKPCFAYIDKKQFQKVIYNIFSNSFKFTPEGGKIMLSVESDESNISITISDTGIGISSEAIDKIFERFYQIENRTSEFTLGTGIGLALTLEIVKAHQGEIKVDSEVNKGSTFIIVLPKHVVNINANTESEMINSAEMVNADNMEWDTLNKTKEFPSISEKPKTVLIVDDNPELLALLKEVFFSKYMVYTSPNGQQGWEMVLKHQPDIVISDIMMPVMTGRELCNKIKNNLSTSHIPVILLTAQDSEEQIIDGLEEMADGYVTKPFNVNILLSQCSNLLNNRKLLLNKYKNGEGSTETGNKKEDEFIGNATRIISTNLGNPDFDLNHLAESLALGRTKLFSMFKQLTGLTPNEFIINLKMKEAVRLLETAPNMNISQIAESLGYSSVKYFSKNFKAFYGLTPQDWRKRQI